MQTVYSIYKNTNPQPGLGEIINMYDNRYFSIAIDGQIIRTTYKESYESTVLKRAFIKECVKISGVDEDNLQFVYIDWESFGEENLVNYDANDYDEYQNMIDVFSIHPNVQFKWRDKYREFVKVLATGIDELEEKI